MFLFCLFVCLRTSFLLLLYHYHILTSDINVSSHKFYHLLRLTLRRSPSLIALIDFAYPLSLVSSYQLVFYSSSRYAFSSPYLRSRLVSFVIVCILCKNYHPNVTPFPVTPVGIKISSLKQFKLCFRALIACCSSIV